MSNQPATANVNTHGHLSIGDCDCIDLASKFGTPLYVMDLESILRQCASYKKAFSNYSNTEICYASKALCNIAILEIVSKQGFGLDVVSGGELYTAHQAQFDPDRIYFHGNNKTRRELTEALLGKVGRIVVDNLYELDQLGILTAEFNIEANVLIRVIPGIEAHTHDFIQTGKIDSKFGIPLDQVLTVVRGLKDHKLIHFKGLHAHIGSQIFDVEPLVRNLEILLECALQIRHDHGVVVEDINIGGGLGIAYTSTEDPHPIHDFGQAITKRLTDWCGQNNFPLPRLIIEPGRSIVANAGVTLYTVGSIKRVTAERTYLAIDGGMSDNPRPILYQSKYAMDIANRVNAEQNRFYTIAGKHCESGDILSDQQKLQEARGGDILAVYATGAYNYAMSSNYNRVCRPSMVLVYKGEAKIIVKRENYEHICANDLSANKWIEY